MNQDPIYTISPEVIAYLKSPVLHGFQLIKYICILGTHFKF